MRLISFLVVFVYAFTLEAFGQIRPSYTPPSPEAASLGVYSAIPVNYYSGIPNVSIPLSEVKIKNIDLAINLSYYSGGIRASQEASSAGLGWVLNSGGVITRTKRDKDDVGSYGYAVNTGIFTCSPTYDMEPDLFFFNFLGRTGRFVFNKYAFTSPTVRLLSSEELVVSYTGTGGWLIIDEKGNRFEFETKENTHEESSNNGNVKTEDYVSSWYLTKITNVFGEVVNFNYQTHTHRTQSSFSSGFRHLLTSYGTLFQGNFCINGQSDIYAYGNYISSYNSTTTTTKTEITNLSSIQYNLGTVEIQYGSRQDLAMENSYPYAPKLEVIRFKNYNNTEIKTFAFGYAYFNPVSGSPDNLKKRLKLTEVRQYAGNEGLNPYTIEYTTSTIQDKGPTNKTAGFIDNLTDGLISKLTYPTGGYTTFEFEPHYNNAGVRIKTISQYDGNQVTNKKTYQYMGAKYFANDLNALYATNYSVAVDGTNCSSSVVYTIGYVHYQDAMYADQDIMGENSSDYLVGYDQVIEDIGTTAMKGRNAYTYYNDNATIYAPTTSGGLANWASVPSSVPARNGVLKSSEILSYNGAMFASVSKNSFDYSDVVVTNVQVTRYNGYNCNGTYNMNSEWVRLNSETEYVYDQGGANVVSTTKTYSYNHANELKPSSVQVQDSKGIPRLTEYAYTRQKAQQSGGVYTSMLNKNMVTEIIEETNKVNGSIVSKSINAFKDWFNNGNVIALETKSQQKGSATPVVKVRFDSYDDKGNPVQFKKENDYPTTIIRGYNKNYVIAEAQNAFASDVAFASFEDPGDPHFRTGGYVQSNIVLYDQHTGSNSYRIKPGNPVYGPTADLTMTLSSVYKFSCWIKTETSYGTGYLVIHTSSTATPSVAYPVNAENYKTETVSNTNGKWKYYEVTLDVSKIRQLSGVYGTLNLRAYVYNTDGAKGLLVDDMRLHPLNARMTTYTHMPLMGMTGQIDVNSNEMLKYQYDKFGRLLFVVDKGDDVLKKYCYNYVGQNTDCVPPIFYSYTTGATFIKSDCAAGATGSTELFTISSGMFSSYLSAMDADLKAQSYLATFGPGYANSVGTCIAGGCSNCVGDDKKCVNGVCLQGIKVVTISNYDPNTGMYECVWHWEFSDGTWTEDYTDYSLSPCQ